MWQNLAAQHSSEGRAPSGNVRGRSGVEKPRRKRDSVDLNTQIVLWKGGVVGQVPKVDMTNMTDLIPLGSGHRPYLSQS